MTFSKSSQIKGGVGMSWTRWAWCRWPHSHHPGKQLLFSHVGRTRDSTSDLAKAHWQDVRSGKGTGGYEAQLAHFLSDAIEVWRSWVELKARWLRLGSQYSPLSLPLLPLPPLSPPPSPSVSCPISGSSVPVQTVSPLLSWTARLSELTSVWLTVLGRLVPGASHPSKEGRGVSDGELSLSVRTLLALRNLPPQSRKMWLFPRQGAELGWL